MITKIKTSLTLLCVVVALYSCDRGEPEMYAESFSVIKSPAGGTAYFSADEGINLRPTTFDSKWGKDGDRVIVGFYYNPAAVTSTASSITVAVENLTRIPTYQRALPSSSADTVGSGKFLDDGTINGSTGAWIAQDYLTVRFWLKYTDGTKHNFGFIEENEDYRSNDTLFLRLWHNTKETGTTNKSFAYMALNLKHYSDYLNSADSTTVAVKYDMQKSDGTNEEKIEYLTYRKKAIK
jgi:hypothetical protein